MRDRIRCGSVDPDVADAAISRDRGGDARHPKRRCHDFALAVSNLR